MSIEFISPEYEIIRNETRCISCRICQRECPNGVHFFNEKKGAMDEDETKCVNCQRCVSFCPTRALKIVTNANSFRENANWSSGTIKEIYKQAETTEDYELISRAKAVEYCTENTLLIVVDTHRPNMTECPELLSIAGKRVVIDHHRLSEDSIEFPTLSYVESYASSTSELMTEILQYTSNKKLINKFEAEALLAGITVDTNSFSIKTGVRTFEAAAWLRKAGADTTEVKRFFQTEVSSFQMKADAVARAEYLESGIAFAISEGYSTDAQIINAQVADELLMVKGVKAVFAVGKNDQLKTVISARSLGDINVQVVMEHFHGGGHLTSAGAQVDLSPEEVIDELKRILPNYVDEKKDKEENEQE